jgi:hypothetical protein
MHEDIALAPDVMDKLYVRLFSVNFIVPTIATYLTWIETYQWRLVNIQARTICLQPIKTLLYARLLRWGFNMQPLMEFVINGSGSLTIQGSFMYQIIVGERHPTDPVRVRALPTEKVELRIFVDDLKRLEDYRLLPALSRHEKTIIGSLRNSINHHKLAVTALYGIDRPPENKDPDEPTEAHSPPLNIRVGVLPKRKIRMFVPDLHGVRVTWTRDGERIRIKNPDALTTKTTTVGTPPMPIEENLDWYSTIYDLIRTGATIITANRDQCVGAKHSLLACLGLLKGKVLSRRPAGNATDRYAKVLHVLDHLGVPWADDDSKYLRWVLHTLIWCVVDPSSSRVRQYFSIDLGLTLYDTPAELHRSRPSV